MCRQSPAMQYITRKIEANSRHDIILFIANSPLKKLDKEFCYDLIDGYSYKELEIKYNKSASRIGQWKRTCYEALWKYEYQQLRK